jgi:peptidoglycan/xylan/chitin deacetylase (PgdA/CDA1 family)
VALDVGAVASSPPAGLNGSVDETEAALALRGVDALARELWADAQVVLAPADLDRPAPTEITRKRRRLPRARAALVPLALAAMVGLGTLRASSGPHAFVEGRWVPLPAGVVTVSVVLRAGGVHVHDGALKSAGTHRVLERRADRARVFLDGVDSSFGDHVQSGEHIRVVDGHDRVEPVDHRRLVTVAAGLPPVERRLWHVGRSGIDVVDVGRLSGEIIRRHTVRAAAVAHPETDKVVALTFDDGPDPRFTPQVLDILNRNGVKATFCTIGLWVEKWPELVRAERDQGHTLCDHTMHHVLHLDHKSHDEVVAEIDSEADLVRQATGHDPQFFRAPGGNLNDDVVNIAHQRNMRVLGWAVDPHDYEKIPAPLIFARIMQELKPGAVILMHDGGGDRTQTIDQLEMLIVTLKQQGYRFAVP